MQPSPPSPATAATGAAIAAGTVSIKCVSGNSTSAVTSTTGSFSLDITGAVLPCLLRVNYSLNGVAQPPLHSVANAAGNVNITPVTELMVANLTAGTPAAAFDNFDDNKVNAITPALLAGAATAVKNYLGNVLGVATTDLPLDPLSAKFTPATTGAAGDKADAVLDDLSKNSPPPKNY